MSARSLKVHLAHLLQCLSGRYDHVVSDCDVYAVELVGAGQPGLDGGDALHGPGQLQHHEEDGLLQVRVVRVELHLVVVVGQLHLEDGQALIVVQVEELDPCLYRPHDQVFELILFLNKKANNG